jgi:hypothetical protein
MVVLYGDFCSEQQVVPANQIAACQQIENGVLTHGLGPAINYLSERYNHLSIATTQDQAELSSLGTNVAIQLIYSLLT